MSENQIKLGDQFYSDPQAVLAEAQARLDRSDLQGSLVLVNQLLAAGHCPAGAYFLRSICFFRANLLLHALHAVEGELALNPSYPGAIEHYRMLNERLSMPGTDLPAGRPWSTGLDQKGIQHFEHCSQRYMYRSIPMIKNAFDLALYPLLLWNIKPRTIIEVGSYYGGSAVWMGDMTKAWGIDTHIYSVDVTKVWTAQHERVTFIEGDGRNLGSVFSDEFLKQLPRPLLVIEDADHSYVTTTAVLNFFHDRLQQDEYIIVEDVMTTPTETGRALQEFLARHSTDYLVDRYYCDYFGTNVTWCVNGFLKRIFPKNSA
jgi:cephalosporin hydroxylase